MTRPEPIDVGFLPLLRTPQGRPLAILPPLRLEREACDVSERLARAGLGRYEGALIAVSRSWIEAIEQDPSIGPSDHPPRLD